MCNFGISQKQWQQFFYFGILLELFLGCIGALAVWNSSTIAFSESWLSEVKHAVLLSVPLLVLQFLVLEKLGFSKFIPGLDELKETVFHPIAQAASFKDIVTLALISGCCEELFFRGFLNPLLISSLGLSTGFILGNVAFAAIHFLGSLRKYRWVVMLYFVVSSYLSLVVLVTQTVLVAALCHAIFNFCSLTYLRYCTSRKALRASGVKDLTKL